MCRSSIASLSFVFCSLLVTLLVRQAELSSVIVLVCRGNMAAHDHLPLTSAAADEQSMLISLHLGARSKSSVSPSILVGLEFLHQSVGNLGSAFSESQCER